MTITERNRRLSEAARLVEDASPGLFGAVRFNMQNGKVRNFVVEDSVMLQAGQRTRPQAMPFGVPPEER